MLFRVCLESPTSALCLPQNQVIYTSKLLIFGASQALNLNCLVQTLEFIDKLYLVFVHKVQLLPCCSKSKSSSRNFGTAV